MTEDSHPLLWHLSARRHRIGKRSALHVMSTSKAQVVVAPSELDPRLRWVGLDERERGWKVDDAYVGRAVEVTRRPGRPSLSGAPGPSRLVQVRMDETTYESMRESAATAGVTASQWVRQAIRDRLNQAG